MVAEGVNPSWWGRSRHGGRNRKLGLTSLTPNRENKLGLVWGFETSKPMAQWYTSSKAISPEPPKQYHQLGLSSQIPKTYWTFLIQTATLSFPSEGGYDFSKSLQAEELRLEWRVRKLGIARLTPATSLVPQPITPFSRVKYGTMKTSQLHFLRHTWWKAHKWPGGETLMEPLG